MTKATKKKQEQDAAIVIPAIVTRELDLHIKGLSPLICHAFSEKAMREMLESQIGTAKGPKNEPRRPMVEYAESLYWLSEKPDFDNLSDEEIWQATQEGVFGFPATAIKRSAVDGAYQTSVTDKKTGMRCAIFVVGEYITINGKPRMREDVARVQGKAVLRYRAEFPEWDAIMRVQYMQHAMSPAQVANAINLGGFAVGIGDWRPQRDGIFGRFTIIGQQ